LERMQNPGGFRRPLTETDHRWWVAIPDSDPPTMISFGQRPPEPPRILHPLQRDMGRAEQQRDMAERRAAGLSGATSGLSVALKAMQDNAARDLASAKAANAKAKLLAPTRPEQDDPNIALAMAQVQGRLPAPTNLADRLASLRQRQTGSS
jgi:hypothetical protein